MLEKITLIQGKRRQEAATKKTYIALHGNIYF
jgi:hypothetical protein